MEEETARQIASQLRKPQGEHGLEVGKKMNEGNKQLIDAALSLIKDENPSTILEIGHGNASHLQQLFEHLPEAFYNGLDYSEDMISSARELNEKLLKDGKARFFLGEANNIPLPDESIDVVFAVNVLYFWDNPSIELAEIRRVLKCGGKLILGVRPRHTMLMFPFTNYNFTMYTKEELLELMEQNKFEPEKLNNQEADSFEIDGTSYFNEGMLGVFSKNC